jgi:hypothetical protein
MYKNCDFSVSKCLRHFDVFQESQELVEDDAYKRRNASELKVISLQEVFINCW